MDSRCILKVCYGLRIVVVPSVEELKKEIMDEAHKSAYAMHPGATKMYQDLKQVYWWDSMKKDIVDYVSRCLTCQQVKAEHQKPRGCFNNYIFPSGK